MVQACAIKERVGSLHLDSAQPSPQKILELPVEAFIPSQDDQATLRESFQDEIAMFNTK